MLEFMNDEKLIWKDIGSRHLFTCRIFSVREKTCLSPDNKQNAFTVIDARNWALVIPVLIEKNSRQFVMVRQWRHGACALSLEFPGGVFEPDEKPEQAAARELWEETGYKPGKISKLGEMSPNPAIMTNKVHFFLAEDLINTGKPCPDSDEYLEIITVDIDEVIKKMGQPPYLHALMGTALSFYLKQQGTVGCRESLEALNNLKLC